VTRRRLASKARRTPVWLAGSAAKATERTTTVRFTMVNLRGASSVPLIVAALDRVVARRSRDRSSSRQRPSTARSSAPSRDAPELGNIVPLARSSPSKLHKHRFDVREYRSGRTRGVRPQGKRDVSTVTQRGRGLVGQSDDLHGGSTLRLKAASVSGGPTSRSVPRSLAAPRLSRPSVPAPSGLLRCYGHGQCARRPS
jgi:hypothetical protein